MKLFYIFLLSIICFNFSSAQEIETGTMELGIISYTLEEGGMVDSTMMEAYLTQMRAMLPSKVYFKKDKIATLYHDESGKVLKKRDVYDVNERISYSFFDSHNKYMIDTIQIAEEDVKKDEIEIISRHPLNKKIFGFKVDSILYRSEGMPDITKAIVAPGITFDNVPSMSMFVINDDFTIRTEISVYNISINFGIISFSRDKIQDEEVFSTSLDGYTDGRPLLEAMLDLYADEEPDNDPPYEGEGINLDKVSNLLAENLIDTSSSYDREMHKEWFDKNINFDKYAILKLLKEEGNSDKISSNLDLINVIEIHQLMSKENIGFLESVVDEDDDLFWNYIYLVQIKEDFSKKETRQNIVQNHVKLGFDNGLIEDSQSKFLEGKIDYSQYVSNVSDLLFPLKTGETKSMKEVEKIIRDFVAIPLDKMTEFSIEKSSDSFIIKTSKFNYPIFYKDIRSINWDVEFDEQKGYTYYDTILLNEGFYNSLLTTVKQIDADYQSPYAFGIYNFDEMIIDSYEASEIQIKHPELKIFDVQLCLNMFLVDEYDVFTDNPISFAHNNKSEDQQFTIRGFKIGDIDGNTPYVTTEKKIEFITFLEKNASVFELTPDKIMGINNSIKNRLIATTADLMDYIPNLGVTLSVFSDPYLMDKNYEPTITEKTNKLKNIFPSLNRLTRGEFEATNFSFEKEPKPTLSFDYNNQRYTTDASTSKMLDKMIELTKDNPINDNYFFKIYKGMGDTKYLYITEKVKDSLSKLLEIRLEKM